MKPNTLNVSDLFPPIFPYVPKYANLTIQEVWEHLTYIYIYKYM